MKTQDLLAIINDSEKSPEEKATAILAIRGKEKNEDNKKYKDLKDLHDNLELELTTVKESYASPEDLAQIAADKKALEDQLANIEETHSEKIKKIEFEHKFTEKIKESGARDIKLLKAVLDMESIEFDGNEIKGFDEQLENVKKDYEYLFEVPEIPKKPGFSRKFNLGETGSMTKDEFKALPPTKRNELFKSDPDLYSQLNGDK